MKKVGFWIALNVVLVAALVGVSFLLYTRLQARQISQFIEQRQEKMLAGNQGVVQEGNIDKTHVLVVFPTDQSGRKIASVEQEMLTYLKEKLGQKKPTGHIEQLVFISSKETPTNFPNVQARELHSESYRVSPLQIKAVENQTVGSILLTSDNQLFTLESFLPKLPEAKPIFAAKLKEDLLAQGKTEEELSSILAKFEALDLLTLEFSYENSQLSLTLPDASYGTTNLSLPIENLFPVIKGDYLVDADKEKYDAYLAAQAVDKKALRQIALTFDDGPNPSTTPRVLDLLKKYNAKATFFIIGKSVPGNEEILKRIVAEGHTLGNHTWNHPDLTTLSGEQVRKEIQDTQDVIKGATGVTPTMVRPPYGALNAAVVNQIGLPSIYWSVDTQDWKTHNPQLILNEVKAHTQPGSIILMHDIHKETVDSLEPMLQFLTGEGYHMVNLQELLGEHLNPQYIYYDQESAGPAH